MGGKEVRRSGYAMESRGNFGSVVEAILKATSFPTMI
jgi:hypothetical protein